MKYPVGTKFVTRHKHPRECEVIDFHVTRNLAGEVVRERYVAKHTFLGQTVIDSDIAQTTIDRALTP